MKRLYAGQRTTHDAASYPIPYQADDGCKYQVQQSRDGAYFIPLYEPNFDITAECIYFLDVSKKRFANLMEYFFYDENYNLDNLLSLKLEEIDAKLLKNKRIIDNVINPNEKDHRRLLAENFCLNVAKLIKSSELRIELNAEYCGIIPPNAEAAACIDDETKATLQRLYARNKTLMASSFSAFEALENLKHKAIFTQKTAMLTETNDVGFLIYEAISEIFKVPPFGPKNPDYEIQTRDSFIPLSIKIIIQLVYYNRLEKTANACSCIHAVGEKLIELAGATYHPEQLLPTRMQQAMISFVSAAQEKAAIAVRDSEFDEVSIKYSEAALAMRTELKMMEGFVANNTSIKSDLELGMEIIDQMVNTKREFFDTAAKFIARPACITSNQMLAELC